MQLTREQKMEAKLRREQLHEVKQLLAPLMERHNAIVAEIDRLVEAVAATNEGLGEAPFSSWDLSGVDPITFAGEVNLVQS